MYCKKTTYPQLRQSATRAFKGSCKKTTYPQLCNSVARALKASRRGGLSAEAVLKMHLGAITHRSESAKRVALKLMRRARPRVQSALKHCAALYRVKWDMVGVSLRDVRGFSVNFYTDQGIYSFVGNNIPVRGPFSGSPSLLARLQAHHRGRSTGQGMRKEH